MKFFLITFLCASLYVDIYKSLISPHISEVQKVCGLNSNSCNPFFFLIFKFILEMYKYLPPGAHQHPAEHGCIYIVKTNF